MAASIPQNYLDLLQKSAFAHPTTLMPDGSPQVSPVCANSTRVIYKIEPMHTSASG